MKSCKKRTDYNRIPNPGESKGKKSEFELPVCKVLQLFWLKCWSKHRDPESPQTQLMSQPQQISENEILLIKFARYK